MKSSQKANKLAIGIDPGTGVKSPLGLAIFNPETREIIYSLAIGTTNKFLPHRIKDISDKLAAHFKWLALIYSQAEVTVYVESFVMRGKGGETLQRLIGSVLGRVPYEFDVVEVSNTKVKNRIASHGHADKSAVANGVLKYFNDSDTIKDLIDSGLWDELDAFAIGIVGNES